MPPKAFASSADVPDVPFFLAVRPRPTTLRALARKGLVVLCACGADVAAAREAAAGLAVPVRVVEAGSLADAGPLAAAGLAEAGEVWVIRPDAHAAAVLRNPGPAQIRAALCRALGMTAAAAS